MSALTTVQYTCTGPLGRKEDLKLQTGASRTQDVEQENCEYFIKLDLQENQSQDILISEHWDFALHAGGKAGHLFDETSKCMFDCIPVGTERSIMTPVV